MDDLVNDSVHWYMSELTSRIVAESGIPGDRFHLGKIMMQCMKDEPELVMQIDGATDESETNGSILARSVRCANCFRQLGLQAGDVMVLMAPNHVDLVIPFNAALFNGIVIAAVDWTLRLNELQSTFSVDRPKIIFCQSEKAPDVQIALNELELNAQIVIFDRGDYLLNFEDFMNQYDDGTSVEDFKCADIDTEDAVAFLVATSGTTGMPKAVAVTHKNIATTTPYLWSHSRNFPRPTRLCLIVSPLQWMTALIGFYTSTIMRYPRLITSKLPVTQCIAYDLINKYRPSFAILSSFIMTAFMKPDERDQCDFSCFELILIGGSAVPDDLVDAIQKVTPKTKVANAYGMSELSSIGFHAGNSPLGSCGKPLGCLQYRLINCETMEDIEEPNVPGELWLKGPGIFKEYYNNPEATAETFAEGRWFKTGDMFYRDENFNFFFVERIKLLLKYKANKISPVEVEATIRQHPGVLDVAVTGIPDPECGDLPVACVVRAPGARVTAQEIKDLVKETLVDSKQLRGGVIFIPALPMSASTKLDRRRVKEMALTMERE